jgi:hypothetical protein
MRFSQEQYEEYMSRVRPQQPDAPEVPDPGPEALLQAKCMKYCREHGYPFFHDRSRGCNNAGFPDLFIFLENRVVLIELKAANGKLRKKQQDLRRTLSWLGHTVHVCRSYSGFIKIIHGEE